MIVRRLEVGPFAENSYIVGCPVTREGALVDPGGDVDDLLAIAAKDKLRIGKILVTHGHWDHVFGVAEAKRKTSASILMPKGELVMFALNRQLSQSMGVEDAEEFDIDVPIDEGDVIEVGNLRFRVLSVPGHSPAHVAFVEKDEAFTGDTLFAGSIGRTDFPGGSLEVLRRSITGKIVPLGPEMKIHPGHGPATTVGREIRENPFLQEWL